MPHQELEPLRQAAVAAIRTIDTLAPDPEFGGYAGAPKNYRTWGAFADAFEADAAETDPKGWISWLRSAESAITHSQRAARNQYAKDLSEIHRRVDVLRHAVQDLISRSNIGS